jgi:hypothetical protein
VHQKLVWLSEDDYIRQRAQARPPTVPPATDEVAVVVPVMRRPQNAGPFMASLKASTGLATAYAVYDPDDRETAQAWVDAGAMALVSDRGSSFAQKVNVGYLATGQPWLFLVGDDVRFHPGWLDQAQAVAEDRFHVIGTNDLGNPRVTSGDHATHLLVRRSYVDEVGASWDGPKVVAHEGYAHWFVDDEIVAAAKVRGVWDMAMASIVEHLHPAWGKGESDEVYELGQSHADADRELFEARRRANGAG